MRRQRRGVTGARAAGQGDRVEGHFRMRPRRETSGRPTNAIGSVQRPMLVDHSGTLSPGRRTAWRAR